MVGVAFAAPSTGPDYGLISSNSRAEHVSCIETLEVRVGRPETLEAVAGSRDGPGVVRTVKHYSTIVSLQGSLCIVHREDLGIDHAAQGTLGFTRSLEVSCTMDADFPSRRVWRMPVPKRGLGSGKWTTHSLVLEVVDLFEKSVEERQQRESGNSEKMAVAVRTFRRMGTGR